MDDNSQEIYDNFGMGIEYPPEVAPVDYSSVSDILSATASDSVLGTVRQNATESPTDIWAALRGFAGTVQDFGNTVINLEGTAAQLDIARTQSQLMATTQKQKLAVNKAKQDQAYKQQLNSVTPIKGIGITPRQLLLFAVIIGGAYYMAHQS